MHERVASLLQALQAERARPAADRETKAVDASLDGVIADVARARDLLAADDRAAAGAPLAQAAHAVGDSWSYTSSLAAEVLACAQAVRSS